MTNMPNDNLPKELMDPWIIWHRAWRNQLRRTLEHPEETGMLCRAAAISHANYIMWETLDAAE